MSIRVKTDVVENAANKISEYNNLINTDYAELEHEIQCLTDSWIGHAADQAQARHRKLKKEYFDIRFHVIEQIPKFLKEQVGFSYEDVETTMVKAIDAFK